MAEPLPHVGTPVVRPAGVYYFTVNVRPLRGEVSVEHLERLSLYNAVYGALLIAAGIAAVAFPYAFFFTLELSMGWVLLAGGLSTLLHTLFLCGAPGTISLLLLSIIHCTIGVWLLSESAHLQISGIILLLASWFLAQGIVKLALTVSLRAIASWPAMLLSSLLSLSLGAAVLLLFPSSAPELLLAVFVGADLIASGIGLMLIAMMASWAVQMVSDTDTPLLSAQQQQQQQQQQPSAAHAAVPAHQRGL